MAVVLSTASRVLQRQSAAQLRSSEKINSCITQLLPMVWLVEEMRRAIDEHQSVVGDAGVELMRVLRLREKRDCHNKAGR